MMVGQTKIGNAFRLTRRLRSPTGAEERARAKKYRAYLKEHPNSYEGLTKTGMKKKEAEDKATLFRRLGRKVGRELGIRDKKVVMEALNTNSGAVSSSGFQNALLHKLQLAPVHNEIKNFVKKQRAIKKHNASVRKALRKEVGAYEALAGKDFNAIEKAVLQKEANAVTAKDKEIGKKEYEGRLAQVAEEKAQLEARIKAARKVVKDDFIRFYKSVGTPDKKPSESDILAIATLAAHGFEISPGEHRYLKKHLLDVSTQAIKERLVEQLDQEGMQGCDLCVLEEYIKTI